jgi:outer membrane protein assembly factor BamB
MAAWSWWRSPWTVWICALVAPPVALVLLWLRRSTAWWWRVAASVLILAWTGVWAVKVLGVGLELDGTGSRPMLSRRPGESHYARLERSRAEQQRRVESGTPAPAPVSEPAPPPAAAPAVPAKPEPAAAPAALPAPYWTDFRGPRRDGHYQQGPILTAWPDIGLPLLWQQPVGGGYASFVIANGKAFTLEQRRRQEVAAAYDVQTGRELWTNSWDADFQEAMGGPGPRATPTWHAGKVYVLGAEGELRCLDADNGRLIWRKNILEDNGAENLTWAMAAAPLVVDEKVIVLPGGRNGKSVVAYHKDTGEPVWKVLDDKQAYSSPMLATVAGKRQILVVSADRMMGLEPADGALLWDYPWKTQYDVNSSQPLVVGDRRIFISSGYGHGAAMVELSPAAGGRFAVREIWKNTRMKNKFTSSVLHEGYIYGLDEAILACLDAETGELKWKGGRYGYGQVLLASGHLIVTTETGELALVKATPERHVELARFPALDGKTWNHPAIADGRLLVRNTTEMACFRIAP